MIVNQWINNQEVESAEYTEARDPGRLTEVVGQVAKGTAEDVDRAIVAAHRAFRSWSATDPQERMDLVRRAADVLEAEKDALAPLVAAENGMLLGRTLGEIETAVSSMRNLAELAEHLFQEKFTQRLEDERARVFIEQKPIGVVAGIIPWNAPVVLAMQKLAPAVLTGNTVVFKPSPFASIGVTVALQKVAQLFPPGVINVVLGDAIVGEALTSHPLVRKISFTGGGETAKAVMRTAAGTLKRVHFELGGNDPAILLDDADLNKAVPRIVDAALRRSGQYCFAVKRVYVPEKVYDRVYDIVRECAGSYRIGHQLHAEATMGPLNNAGQFRRVKELIDRIRESPARMVEVGEKLEPDQWENGYYLQPVVVRDVSPDAEIVTCEQFGPVIPLIPYRTEEEAIRMANDTEYGLGSSVWSENVERAIAVARRIESGLTFVNAHGPTRLGHKYVPFGGVKQSGIGWENSEEVFREFLVYHSIDVHK